ncbi:MAG: hypothetical protein KJ955_08145 [Nanoarchaeota archaeon]|nr:hypothetical protein [Nanoarchaeota archaeon]
MGWFSKKKASAAPERKLILKTFTIEDEADVMDAVNHVRLGTTIAFIKIKSNVIVRDALKSMKEACSEMKGEIVGLPDGWYIAAPPDVQIVKKSVNAGKQVAEAIISQEHEDNLKSSHNHLRDKLIIVDEFDTL